MSRNDWKQTTNLVAILDDGKQIPNGPFESVESAYLAIHRWIEVHGEALRAVGITTTQTHAGKLHDFSCSHYTRSECVELAERVNSAALVVARRKVANRRRPVVNDYELRVRAFEAQGLTRSDAQAAVDAEDLQS